MHTPTGYYAAHNSADNAADDSAGMTSKRMHRFIFDRNRKANPHLMQSADYHIYNMVAHQDPYAVPGGPDTQALIIEEACGLLRRVRCPEIQNACTAPYQQESCASYTTGVSGSRRSYSYAGGSGRQSPRTPYPASEGQRFDPPVRRGGASEASSGYLGPQSARDSQGYSARDSQARRSDRVEQRRPQSSRGSGGGGYSASGYSRATPKGNDESRPRPASGNARGSQRSSMSGSEMRSDYGSRSSRPRSADGGSRGTRSYYSQSERSGAQSSRRR